MCVTADFYNEVGNVLPTWLTSAPTGCHTRAYYSRFHLSNGPVDLIRRWTNRPLYWLWHTLRRWPVRTPELRQAGTAFHLQRHDIPTPRLLAFGQRFLRPWRAESFLLTEPMVGCRDLVAWLLNHRDSPGRRQVLHAAGRLVHRLHQAGHVITGSTLDLQSPFAVQTHADQRLAVVLHDLSGVERRRKAGPRRRRADLLALARALARTGCNSADALRLFLAYHDATWLTVALRPSFRHLLTMFRRVTTRARYEATRWTVLTADPLEHRSTAAGVERTAA